MIPFTPDERRAQFAPSQNVGGAVDRDVLDIIGAQPQQTMAGQVDYDVPDIKPVDPDVVDIVNKNQGPLMASLMGASKVNPDQAAEARRLGSQIGIGQDIALRNMDEVRQRAFMAEVQRRDIARANPVLAGFLTDRTFANQASDDIGTLDRIGLFFEDIGRAAAGRPMEYTAGELVRGYMRGQLVAERGEIGTRAILGEAEETNFARAKQIQQEMRALTGGGILASTAEVVAQNVAQAREVVGAGLIGGAAGSVVPGIGTMTGFAGGLGTGIVLTTAKMEAGNLYLDLQEQGISDDTAVPIAVGAGLLNGVIEEVGMKIASAPFRQLASRVMREQIAEAVRKPMMRSALAAAGKAYVVQVGSEAAEEGLQEIVNIAGEELAKGMEGIDSETTMRDAAKRVLDSFVQGAMGGSILGGIGPGANLYVDLRRANKATKQTQFFNDLSKNATESKLKARDAGAYERFVSATADGTGAETVFVDGATMRDVLTQAGVTDAQLEAIVPGVAQQVRQATELGNDVTLPTAQFAGRLAGTPLGDALLPHMRLSPDAMSAMEAQQFEQSREALVEEARALLEAKTEAESAFVQEADQVATTMRDRLIAVGRDPALAEVESLVHQAFVVTQAARQGKTPAQFEAESGLREIVGAEMPAAPLEQAATVNVWGVATPQYRRAWHKATTGQPITVTTWHSPGGTRAAQLTDFARERMGRDTTLGGGWYGARDRDIAEIYGTPQAFEVTLQNPYVFSEADKNFVLKLTNEELQWIRDAGYDGIIVKGVNATLQGQDRSHLQVVAFNPGTAVRQAAPGIMEQAAVPASLDAVANVESAFAFAGTKAFKTNREFKQELQDRVLSAAKDAGIDLSQFTPEVEQYLVRVAVADAITALRTNPNAVGWYNEKVTKALRLVSLVHPEIATEPQAKFAFTWALAVTSNGLEVNKNFQLAERVYREYKQTGQMPTNVQAGQAQIAINASLGLFNDLVAKYGIDAVEQFMTTKATVKEVMSYTNKNVSGENLTTEVYGAAALGPKIGNGFFANLYGHFEQLTMDRWLMRTWGRWTGTLLDDNRTNIATKRKQLSSMIKAMSADDKKAFEKILGSKLAISKPDDVAVAIQKASVKPANRIDMARIGIADAAALETFAMILGEPARGIQRVSFGDELRKVGNALAKYLDGQKEAPSGPPERARIRQVMSQVLAELQTQFPSLTMSDLQALLWYPEKRLYDAAKTADEGKTGYEDNEAPDYANAAANLARSQGISDADINATIGEVDEELSAISRERAAGAERGLGELVLRQAAGGAGGRFEQAARGPARGGYDPSRLKILFGKGADFTTGAHELTHYYVDYYTKQAMAGTATPQMLADLDAMFKFMGVAGDTPEARMAAFNAMPFETARPLIETITYNAEIYLFEGKAPSLELAGVFDRMLAFFRRAYKSLADFVTQQQEIYRREFGRELPALNDDLRAVFDRMLADERQIKQAQAVAQMRGQFTVKPEGMDDAEWAAYQEMAGEATNAAIADMTKASLRQMEWLSRARSRIIKDMQARHTAQRKEVRERVQKDVQQEPLYRAMAFLRRGQVVAPDGTVTEAEGVYKIDRVLAAEFAPTVDLVRLGGRYGVLQDDGLHPDIVAEMFGYPTGGTLLEALAAAKPMREAVEDRTDAEMLRLYGEMNTPEAREQEIQKALHNEARARLVGVELRFMGKIQQPVRVLMEAARQAAKQVIDRKIVRDIRPSEFVAAEAKAAREATAAMQDNKPDVAVRAKRAQLLNNQLAKAALEVKDEIDDGVRYLRRVLRDSNRQRMGADVADQIASLLDRFNIAPMTADEARRVGTLAEFLASLEDRGLVPDIAEAIGMRDTRIPYKNTTIAEFRDLVDAVKQLEYVGKNERKILLAKEKAEFGAVRDQIVASVIENAGDRKANARTATTNIGRAVTAMKGFAAAHLKAASIVRILDGGKDGGPLWNYLIRSANEAGDTETSMRAEATAELTKIIEPVFRAGKLGGKGVFYPSINRSLNREARLVVALNMGNAGNMQRLLDGEGWSMEAVMPVLQSLTEDELNTVQQIWDYFEKYRPMIGQKERRLYGKEPSWVEPQPLVVRSADGKTVTLRGGYYPIKYDSRASLRAETMSEADEAKRDLAGAYTTATTRRSFVKARVRKVEGRPLLYTLAGMYGGINDVIHDLTWHEWLIQANRLMRSNSFDDAVRNRYGPEYVAQLKNWIKDVASGERGVQNEAEMALNFLRQGISSAGLGFNIVSAAMQITGFNQSIVRVGARWIGRGIAYVAQNPMIAMREVNEKSEFMRNRSRTQFRELNEIRNMVQGQSVAMRRVQMGTYFLMMRMQRMVDVPTWHGAYEKAMYEGRDEETAIALADQAVIDSQGGGMVKDLARVERGGPAVKLFTVFYGYMNTVYNMAAVQTMTNKNKGKLAADYAMLFVVPVVLSYMLKQALIPRKGDEDEEWDMGKIGRELAAEQLSYLMGTMVIAREFGEVGKRIFGVEGPRMGYGGPAGLRAIGETYQFATQASQGEFDTAFRKSAVNMIGAFTGLPSAQVNRTIDGLEALYEGETQNVLAPLTGAKKR